MMFDVMNRLPADHPVHRLNARCWSCMECASTGFIRDLAMVIEDGTAGCPYCGSQDVRLLVVEGAA